eukprot:m.190825 g.190825  ORF g.190825 m.190825 type:complete len:186 (-) comp32415_c1_seq1:1000-1557(-)
MAFRYLQQLSNRVGKTWLLIPVGITIYDTVGSVYPIQGASMRPTLNPDQGEYAALVQDWVVLSKWSARTCTYQRGDVVAICSPGDSSKWMVKRLIAMDGDVIKVPNYKDATKRYMRIPEGHCWVEGDNQNNAGRDSNTLGPLPMGLVKGRVSGVVWPPSRIQIVNREADRKRFVSLNYRIPMEWP